MRLHTKALCIILLLLPVAARGYAQDKSDQQALAGTWKVMTMTLGDQDIASAVATKFSYTFAANKVTARGRLAAIGSNFQFIAGAEQLTVMLGKSGQLKTIDLKAADRNRKVIAGIYELDGDKLKISLNYAGVRPKDFTDQAETTSHMVCERAKK